MALRGVEVKGLRQVASALKKMGADANDLKNTFERIGAMVAGEAKGRVNTKTGRLAGSIRPSRTQNKSVVRAGSGRVPYAGVNHFGGYNNITPNPYLTSALEAKRGQVVSELDKELSSLIKKHKLN